MVEASPEIQKELASELERVQKTYGFTAGANVQDLPPMKFQGNVYFVLFEVKEKRIILVFHLLIYIMCSVFAVLILCLISSRP